MGNTYLANAAASAVAVAGAPQCSGAVSAATAMRRMARRRDASVSESASPATGAAAAAAAVSNGVQSVGQHELCSALAIAEAAADRRAGCSTPVWQVKQSSNPTCASVAGTWSVTHNSPTHQHAFARNIAEATSETAPFRESAGKTRRRAEIHKRKGQS